jgi:hypothetical protein
VVCACLSLLLAIAAANAPQPAEARRPALLLVIDQGHLSRESVPEMLDAIETVLTATRGAETRAVIVSGRRLVYPDATREALEGSLSGTEGFYDQPRRFGMSDAEAREIVRGNESVRDAVRRRGGGADVVVNARVLIEEVQELGEATLASITSVLATGPRDEVAVIVSDRPVFFRAPDEKIIERLGAQLRGPKRLVIVPVQPSRSIDSGDQLLDGFRLLSSLPNTTVVSLSSPGATSELTRILEPPSTAKSALPPAADPSPGRTGSTVDQLVDRASSRVVRFSEGASFLVASEDYTQEVKSRAGSFNLPPTATAGITIEKRRLESEVALVQLVDREVWLLARDVVYVDGKPVPDSQRQRIPSAKSPSTDAAVRDFEAIAQAGARFNIGPIQRNLSVPTLALWFLTPKMKQQFQFDHVGREKVEGVDCDVIRFKELGKGMLQVDGNPVPASGRYWVASGTGDVVKTELLLARTWSGGRTTSDTSSGGRARIVVTYRFEQPVDSWVPAEMEEFYAGVGGRLAEWVVGKAKYSDYRRFGVETRIR